MRIAVIFSILFFILAKDASAQVDSLQLSDEFLEQADEIYKNQKEAIEIAKEMYVQAVSYNPNQVRANWMAGQLYIETINKDRALDYFIRVKDLDPNYRFDIDYQIGLAYQYGFEFESAIEYFQKYYDKYYAQPKYRGKDRTRIENVKQKLEECKNAKLIINKPAQYSLVNLGENINSAWPDYAPVINEEETVMIFTSRRQEGNLSPNVDEDNYYFEDVFISRRENGSWGPAKNIGTPVNTSYHDSNIALSNDGNRLYIYKDTGRGDIYYSEFDGSNWSEPKFLSDKINSSTYTEHSITETSSPDVVIYSTDRPGGEGGIDLFACSKDSKGNWYRTKSLGSVINTKGDEDSPFMGYDGKTLYFSSNGHKGYGGFDIFKSVYDSASGEWSEPENLGYPVNTPDNELYFHPTKDGRRSYFASVREGGIGYTDIFMVKYHGEDVGPQKQQIQVALADLAPPKKEKGSESGDVVKEVPPAEPEFQEREKEIIKVAHAIYFDASQSHIQDVHQKELNEIVEIVKTHPKLKIDIAGYASKDGNPKYNLDLSHTRAMIVHDYLISKGIDDSRIIAKGFGSLENAEGGNGEENRRADVKIIGGQD